MTTWPRVSAAATTLAICLVASTASYAQFATGGAPESWREQRRQVQYFDPYTRGGYWRDRYEYRPRRSLNWGWPQYRGPYDHRGDFFDRRDQDLYEPQDHSYRKRAPQVEVQAPQYHTYVPDTLKSVQFDNLCELEVASRTEHSAPAVAGLFAEACAFAPSLVFRMLPEVAEAIRGHYTQHPQLLWIENGKISGKARAAMAALDASDRVGLLPAEYRVTLPHAVGEGAASLKAFMRFELALSAKVLTYVLDATRGRVDPNRISGYHDLPRKSVNLVDALEQIAQSQDVGGYLKQRNPGNAQFRALVAELARLRNGAAEPRIAIADDTLIRPGESDPELASVIAAIRQTGSAALLKRHTDALAESEGAVAYTGDLVALVRDFQRESGLKADGIVGENTIRAMTRDSTADKIEKVRLALERLRWLPHDFGERYVFLNQPAFEVTYVESGRTPLSMRAIIGKKSNQTYFFTDKIETVEYNPSWGVPRSIIINEMLAKLYRNPSYLDRLGYEVRTRSGRRVSSRAVNWSRVAHDKTYVSVRQPPGEDNALGQLKIDFPNKHAIYMHDTPKKALFNRQRRAFSHGCVRLQHPRLLAAAILGESLDYIDSRIATGHSRSEKVQADIPVYLAYFTAWPDADGTVRYYDDVYDRDQYLASALAKTQEARSVKD